MQRDLISVSTWLSANNLKLNVSKTKVVIFNKEGLFPDVDLFNDEEKIEVICSFKLLGLVVDQELSFNDHYQLVYKKLVQFTFIVRKLVKMLPLSCLRTLYFAYFHSNLIYCLPIWLPLISKKCQDAIYVLQKCIVRAISGKSMRIHCMPLFKENGILTLMDQIYLDSCKLMSKVMSSACPQPVIHLFDIGRGTSDTRS